MSLILKAKPYAARMLVRARPDVLDEAVRLELDAIADAIVEPFVPVGGRIEYGYSSAVDANYAHIEVVIDIEGAA